MTSGRRFGVFSVNFERIFHFFLVYFIVDFKQVNVNYKQVNK